MFVDKSDEEDNSEFEWFIQELLSAEMKKINRISVDFQPYLTKMPHQKCAVNSVTINGSFQFIEGVYAMKMCDVSGAEKALEGKPEREATWVYQGD